MAKILRLAFLEQVGLLMTDLVPVHSIHSAIEATTITITAKRNKFKHSEEQQHCLISFVVVGLGQ